MPIRYRPERNGWLVYWTNPATGKRQSKLFHDEYEAQKLETQIQYKLKFERESFGMGVFNKVTLEEVVLEYIKEKKFDKTNLRWVMTGMKKPLEMYGDAPISELTKEKVELVQNALLDMGNKAVTARDRMRVFRTVFRWAIEKGYCTEIRWPKSITAVYQHFVPPTPSEIEALYKAAEDHPMIQRVLIIGSQTGVRVGPSEMFKMKWVDVDYDRSVVLVRSAKKNRDCPWREVPITEETVAFLKNWQAADDDCPWIFHTKNGKPLQVINRMWSAVLKKANMRNIRPYDLRHSYATNLIAAGVDIGTVASLMGHKDAKMILSHYQYVMTSQKVAAVEHLPKPPMSGGCNHVQPASIQNAANLGMDWGLGI